MLRHCYFLLIILAVTNADTTPRVAVATLTPRTPGLDILGHVEFTETDNGLHITGTITGLPVGNYGFHVHALGDISTCDASGPHFNPEDVNHGGRNHTVRHVGDLGNVEFTANSSASNATVAASIDIVDNILALRGQNNIIGRTLVLHAQEDDLGLGEHETSLTTGNAGARVACGVIGLRSPVDSWNSAITSAPSVLLSVASLFIAYLCL